MSFNPHHFQIFFCWRFVINCSVHVHSFITHWALPLQLHLRNKFSTLFFSYELKNNGLIMIIRLCLAIAPSLQRNVINPLQTTPVIQYVDENTSEVKRYSCGDGSKAHRCLWRVPFEGAIRFSWFISSKESETHNMCSFKSIRGYASSWYTEAIIISLTC